MSGPLAPAGVGREREFWEHLRPRLPRQPHPEPRDEAEECCHTVCTSPSQPPPAWEMCLPAVPAGGLQSVRDKEMIEPGGW